MSLSSWVLRSREHAWIFALYLWAGRPIAALQTVRPKALKHPKYLSDLPTPSFLLDLLAIERAYGEPVTDRSFQIGDWVLNPVPQSANENKSDESPLCLGDLEEKGQLMSASGDVCFGYIHTKVLEPRQEGRFLAKLDLPDTTKAHLVLGLNNHHVISYYWARSAGMGAAMEAPGIALRQGNRLEWSSDSGFTDCNSNDGKRSEWVNFLTAGDQIQLRPSNLPESLELFQECIYGISNAGRPLGAEPVVVCHFKLDRFIADE